MVTQFALLALLSVLQPGQVMGNDGSNSKLFLFICIVLLITSKFNTIVSLQLLQCSVTLS